MQDDDEDKQNDKDHEEAVLEIMEDNDLDEHQAHQVIKLEGEGYDEEDAVAKAQDVD